jgi:hypothetical protein
MANGDDAIITKETFVNIWAKDDSAAQGEILYDLLNGHFKRIIANEKRVGKLERVWLKVAGAIVVLAFVIPIILRLL